jgi:type IV fimbrial biogenesis protein FimT
MMRNRNGWTLIELIVAIGLLAIMLSIGSLAQSKLLPNYRVSAAARQVVTDLRLLRSKAISQNHQFRMITPARTRTARSGGTRRRAHGCTIRCIDAARRSRAARSR